MNRGVDLLITYRVIKMLVTPFNKTDAYKYGIIDEEGKVLRPYRTIKSPQEKRAYTMLHRFVFNLKRILAKVGIKGALGSFAVAAAILFKENKNLLKHKTLIESTIIGYLKKNNLYENMMNEHRKILEINEQPIMTCFGIDVYEKEGQLYSEDQYEFKV
jgi:hypothetical protein